MDDDDDASVAGIEGGKGEFSHSFSFNQDYGTQDVAVPGNLSPAAGFGENDFTGTSYAILYKYWLQFVLLHTLDYKCRPFCIVLFD